jgi:hypothetical protein
MKNCLLSCSSIVETPSSFNEKLQAEYKEYLSNPKIKELKDPK